MNVRDVKRNLLIDALISVLLVTFGFGIFNHFTAAAKVGNLLRSGGIAMTEGELINHVRAEKITAYWFGPKPGYKYTIICKDKSEIIVTYLPQGVNLNHPDRLDLTVETYSNTLKKELPANSSILTDRDDFITADGTAGTRQSASPHIVRFSLPDTGKIVEVQSPSTSGMYDVYVAGDGLKLISEAKS